MSEDKLIDELLGLCRQLAEWVDNPNDSIKETILSRYGGSATAYVANVETVARRMASE